jgi:hypothetical protein
VLEKPKSLQTSKYFRCEKTASKSYFFKKENTESGVPLATTFPFSKTMLPSAYIKANVQSKLRSGCSTKFCLDLTTAFLFCVQPFSDPKRIQ